MKHLLLVLTLTWLPTAGFAQEVNSGTTGDCTWTLTETDAPHTLTLTISGNGSMSDQIPWYAYRDDIRTLILKEGVTNIAASAFEDCSSLTTVTIPNSVTQIGELAFYGCGNLTAVHLPDRVTSIEDYTFYGCSSLTSVRLPGSVTRIGNVAFLGCSSLPAVRLPDRVTSIGEGAFYDCSSLTDVTIPGSVTGIGEAPFAYCNNLTDIQVEQENKDCSSIDGVLFGHQGTVLLQYPAGKAGHYAIPSHVKSLGNYAFLGCRHLTGVTIPGSVTRIGNVTFSDCSSLTNIQVEQSNTLYRSIDGVLFANRERVLLQYPAGKTGHYAIPDRVQSIEDYAFSLCGHLTAVTIPDNVTHIGRGAFEGCGHLTAVTIPGRVTGIEDYTFSDCRSLTAVTIPGSVTTIGNYAFEDCHHLTDVTVEWATPLTVDTHLTFFNVDLSHVTLHVPQGTADRYQDADVWKEFGKIVELATGTDRADNTQAQQSPARQQAEGRPDRNPATERTDGLPYAEDGETSSVQPKPSATQPAARSQQRWRGGYGKL